MADKEEAKRRYCREHPEDPDCQEHWDEEEPPKSCGCETNYHPASTREFQSENDLLCNLGCYNGILEVVLYHAAILRGMDPVNLAWPPTYESRYMGKFFEYNEDVPGGNEITLILTY